mmetsp:Transcript_95587/g.275423  ORF Transcript_95587/g.275423 Transcript_95587/m.275423 type:complete len:302 (+) Transcript_95587:1722-2627(+)
MPAFASPCSRLHLALVLMIGSSRFRMTPRKAPTSIGSPSAVPVPWSSATRTSPGTMLASRIEARKHSCCEGPCGAVMEALRPSWLMAVPQNMAKRPWWSLSVMDMVMPLVPSPLAKPSAVWSKVKHLPLLESIFMPQRPIHECGPHKPFVPIATAQLRYESLQTLSWSGSTRRSALCAVPVATREEEHAVSLVLTGPRMPKMYDKRPLSAWALRAFSQSPVSSVIAGESFTAAQSVPQLPTYTPMFAPLKVPLVQPALCRTLYPISRAFLCRGSVLVTCSSDMPKNSLSNAKHVSSKTKPP